MNIVFLYANGESIPFLSMRCDYVVEHEDHLDIVRGHSIVEISDYAFYDVFECMTGDEESAVCDLMQEFKTQIEMFDE